MLTWYCKPSQRTKAYSTKLFGYNFQSKRTTCEPNLWSTKGLVKAIHPTTLLEQGLIESRQYCIDQESGQILEHNRDVQEHLKRKRKANLLERATGGNSAENPSYIPANSLDCPPVTSQRPPDLFDRLEQKQQLKKQGKKPKLTAGKPEEGQQEKASEGQQDPLASGDQPDETQEVDP